MNAFEWKNLDFPVLLCPPMDGITDLAYRELVALQGGSAALYCEFINVKGLIYQNPKTLFELRFTPNQRPIVAQLFGNDPEDFYEASKLVVRLGFDAIDINMGCPAHKVASKGCGCALMQDTENAKNIVKKTIQGAMEQLEALGDERLKIPGYRFPVTTKMRLGISDKTLVYEHGMAMIKAGSQAVAIHGRTLKQMYTGEADWEPVKKFKELVLEKYGNAEYVPKVYGSGDVKSVWEAFKRIITTGADGVMIGRGSFGNLWVFEKKRSDLMKKYLLEVQEHFGKGVVSEEELLTYPKISEIETALANPIMEFGVIAQMAIQHAKLIVEDKGEKGMLQMRKHLGWYFNGFEGAKQLRTQLMQVNTVAQLEEILNGFQPPKLEV